MSDIRRRLHKLQMIAGGRGCAMCEHWNTTVVQIVTRDASPSDDDPLANLPRSGTCPRCGRRPPKITNVIQIVAPDVDDAEYMADA